MNTHTLRIDLTLAMETKNSAPYSKAVTGGSTIVVRSNHSVSRPEDNVLASNLVVGAEQEGVRSVDHVRGEAPPDDEDHLAVFGHLEQLSGQAAHVRQHLEKPCEQSASTLPVEESEKRKTMKGAGGGGGA